MAQLFHRSMNSVARLTVFGLPLLAMGSVLGGTVIYRSGYLTGKGEIIDQPVPFSHKHHVGELGIDCRYCHTAVETSGYAGIPPTKTCMNCHQQIWTGSEMLGGGFSRAFFFSVQTFATIGYGQIGPNGLAANLVVTVEALVGLIYQALASVARSGEGFQFDDLRLNRDDPTMPIFSANVFPLPGGAVGVSQTYVNTGTGPPENMPGYAD